MLLCLPQLANTQQMVVVFAVCCLVRTCYWPCNLIVPVSIRGRPSLLLSQQINQRCTYMCNIKLFGICWRWRYLTRGFIRHLSQSPIRTYVSSCILLTETAWTSDSIWSQYSINKLAWDMTRQLNTYVYIKDVFIIMFWVVTLFRFWYVSVFPRVVASFKCDYINACMLTQLFNCDTPI